MKPCPFCGEPMTVTTVPRDYICHVPLTNISIIVRLWNGGKEYYCLPCIRDQENEPYKQAYQEGQLTGYNKGYDDAQRG